MPSWRVSQRVSATARYASRYVERRRVRFNTPCTRLTRGNKSLFFQHESTPTPWKTAITLITRATHTSGIRGGVNDTAQFPR